MILSITCLKLKVRFCSGSCPRQVWKVSKNRNYPANLGTQFGAVPLPEWISLCLVRISLVLGWEYCLLLFSCAPLTCIFSTPLQAAAEWMQVCLPINLFYLCWTNPVLSVSACMQCASDPQTSWPLAYLNPGRKACTSAWKVSDSKHRWTLR